MDEKPNAAQPKSRRRWYQFGLRTLLIGVTLAGCGFGWIGAKVRDARRQAAAVEAIKAWGGTVFYDYQFGEGRTLLYDAVLPGPGWMHSMLGDDLFRNACWVDLTGVVVVDADLARLRELVTLKWVFLSGPWITDASLGHLKGFSELKGLGLERTKVTTAGLKQLDEFAQLSELSLDGTPVTDAALEHLKKLTGLRVLGLRQTQVTDVGLEQLKGLSQLKELRLNNTQVSDEGVARLQRALPKCKIETGNY